MVEIIAIILLVFLTWINVSTFYIRRKISRSLLDVKKGQPIRALVSFHHYLRYLKIKTLDENDVAVYKFDNKTIQIFADGNETVLRVQE